MGVREVKHGFASNAHGQRLGIYLSGSWAVGRRACCCQELISLGKLMQNAFIERFNRTYRTGILDFYLFRTLKEAREVTENLLNEYNSERPHVPLNNLTPKAHQLMRENRKSQKLEGTKPVYLQ